MKKKNKTTKVVKVKEKAVAVIESLAEPMSLADVFVKSGMFPDLKTQAQGVVKILAGRELGLAPLESMTNIYIVNGKVALQAKIIGSLIKKSKKYDYQLEKLDDQECILVFYVIENEKKIELGKSSFTIKDAAKAGIVNKDVWKAYPRNLLFARALSNGSKWYCADVFCGYVAEELEKTVDTTSIISINNKGKVIENDEQKK